MTLPRAVERRTAVPLALVLAVTLGIAAALLATLGGTPALAADPAERQPLAEVNGEAISAEEVEKALAGQLAKLEEQIYALKRQKVEALIRDKLLAQAAVKRGISVQALLDAEVTSKVTLVTEQEIEKFYQANKSQIRGDEATAREQIRARLQNQKRAPSAFSDFHCPFCKQAQPTLARVLSRYGDKVRLVYRDFPIEQLHPGATKAAEGGRCAHEQGKFWGYHDILFQRPPGQGPDDLKTYARQAGLDPDAFERCLASEKYAAAVRKDMADGARLGVTGTPGFFINGRPLSGAQPLEAFARLIDEELSRTK